MADAEKSTEPRRARRDKMRSGSQKARTKLASAVWLLAVVCALFLAVGALLVALKANENNAIVAFVLDVAKLLDLGVFSREEGIFTFKDDPNNVRGALINWGIGAVAYLLVGKVLDRVIRP